MQCFDCVLVLAVYTVRKTVFVNVRHVQWTIYGCQYKRTIYVEYCILLKPWLDVQ